MSGKQQVAEYVFAAAFILASLLLYTRIDREAYDGEPEIVRQKWTREQWLMRIRMKRLLWFAPCALIALAIMRACVR